MKWYSPNLSFVDALSQRFRQPYSIDELFRFICGQGGHVPGSTEQRYDCGGRPFRYGRKLLDYTLNRTGQKRRRWRLKGSKEDSDFHSKGDVDERDWIRGRREETDGQTQGFIYILERNLVRVHSIPITKNETKTKGKEVLRTSTKSHKVEQT